MSTNRAGMAAYEQVADAIRQDIRADRLKPGTKLSSHRELAEEHGVALGTAQKAVKHLEDQGWLVARPSVGVFVADGPPVSDDAVTLADLRDRLANLQRDVAVLTERVDRIDGTHRPQHNS